MARTLAQRVPIFAVIAFKAAKILSILKVVKFTKLLVTATSMLLSVLAYGLTFGPLFAVAIVSMIFIHEMGHVIAIRRQGFPSPAPVFIPFVGAAIFTPPEVLKDRHVEAYVGYGGPLIGSLAAYACIAAWWYTSSQFLLFVGFLGIYLNLFNLIPIRPLDGGRITQALSPYFKYIGLTVLIAYTLFLRQPSLIILWIFVLSEIKFPLWWRPALSLMLTIGMTVLFFTGYGLIEDNHPVPWWLVAIDVTVGALLTVVSFRLDRERWNHRRLMEHINMVRVEHGLPPEPVVDFDIASADDRPYPALRTRLSWLVIYSLSVVILWATMAYLIQEMPH